MTKIFLEVDTMFFLPGPIGQLEVMTAPAIIGQPTKAIAIICHPHPLFGGTMHNKVVTTLSRAFQNLGLCTVRFNFRGVGKSTGSYAEGIGEMEDLLAIIQWVESENAGVAIWLAGFSFGAYIAARMATQWAASQLILVAPPVVHFPMAELPPFHSPCLVLQGEQDEIVSPLAVYEWVDSRQPKPTIIHFPNTTHFFHNHLTELRKTLEGVFLSFP